MACMGSFWVSKKGNDSHTCHTGFDCENQWSSETSLTSIRKSTWKRCHFFGDVASSPEPLLCRSTLEICNYFLKYSDEPSIELLATFPSCGTLPLLTLKKEVISNKIRRVEPPFSLLIQKSVSKNIKSTVYLQEVY